jgi:hypothetical protein
VAFDDARGLAEALANHGELTSCFVRTVLRYARGVLETKSEAELIAAFDGAFAERSFAMPALMLAIVTDPTFREVGAL